MTTGSLSWNLHHLLLGLAGPGVTVRVRPNRVKDRDYREGSEFGSLGFWRFLPVEIERTPAAKVADKGKDWRAEVGASNNSSRSVDLARAGEPGRGREANTPAQIPPRGWRDILWRVLWSISVDRTRWLHQVRLEGGLQSRRTDRGAWCRLFAAGLA